MCRALDGAAESVTFVAIVSILMAMFPTKTSSIISWTETFAGIGYLVGPAVGSWLFEVGGFKLPFWIVGGSTILIIIITFLVVPDVNRGELATGPTIGLGWMDAVRSPRILSPLIDVFICSSGTGMIESMIDPFMLEAEGATATDVGMMFLLDGVVYMAVTIVFGALHVNPCQKILQTNNSLPLF